VIRQTAGGIELEVRVIPRARRSALAGIRDGRLVVRLSAPPVDGAANEALIEFLAALVERPRRAVRIVSGETSREKRVAIEGLTADAAKKIFTLPPDDSQR
jgi:uncharacterized protein (TIGR00251 family)